MGTSGAYGGSPGFRRVDNETQEWLDSGGGTGGGSGDGTDRPEPDRESPPDVVPLAPPSEVPAALAGVIAALGHALAAGSRGAGAGGGRGGAAGRWPGGGSAGGSGTRSTGRATSVGARALGGAYGLRGGVAEPLAELGLDLAELSGLPRFEQARRILESAIGPSGDVFETELRQACAEVVLWALTEEVEPSPIDLTNRWVVEYVWQVWVTEEGPRLQGHRADGFDRARAEQELRAALEAAVAAHGLPGDRPLTTADFAAAIEQALASLRRIGGTAA
jgi:hypothetical protein